MPLPAQIQILGQAASISMRVIAAAQLQQCIPQFVRLVQQCCQGHADVTCVKTFSSTMMPVADQAADVAPEPAATSQSASKALEAIIVRPAASSLPKILCSAPNPASHSTSEQSQALLSANAASCVRSGSGCKRKDIAEPKEPLPRQRSRSLTPLLRDQAFAAGTGADATGDCWAAAAESEVKGAALSRQAKQQATFNVVTSGEYSHLTVRQQPPARKSSPFAEPPGVMAVDSVASQTPYTGLYSQEYSEGPFSSSGCSASDQYNSNGQSCGDMPVFGTSQQSTWAPDFDAQLTHCQLGIGIEPAALHQDGSFQPDTSKHWINNGSHGLGSNTQVSPYIADLPLLSDTLPAPCFSWEQQSWQNSWQNQACGQQHVKFERLEQHQQQPKEPLGLTANAKQDVGNARSLDLGGCGGDAEAAFWLLNC